MASSAKERQREQASAEGSGRGHRQQPKLAGGAGGVLGGRGCAEEDAGKTRVEVVGASTATMLTPSAVAAVAASATSECSVASTRSCLAWSCPPADAAAAAPPGAEAPPGHCGGGGGAISATMCTLAALR